MMMWITKRMKIIKHGINLKSVFLENTMQQSFGSYIYTHTHTHHILTIRTIGTRGENLYHQTGSSGWLEATTANIKNVQQESGNAGNSLIRAGSGHRDNADGSGALGQCGYLLSGHERQCNLPITSPPKAGSMVEGSKGRLWGGGCLWGESHRCRC